MQPEVKNRWRGSLMLLVMLVLTTRLAASQGASAGAANEEEHSDYHNDDANYEDEATGEEEEDAPAALPPAFLSSPLNLTLRPGDNVTLPCRVDSPGKWVQMWLNGSVTITVKEEVLGDKSRVSRLPDMSLFIRGVRPEDTGAYTCQITSEPLATLRHFVKVPAPAKILSHSSKQSVILGQPLSLHCSVWGSPEPSVKWTLQGHSVPDAVYSADGGTLTIKSVTKHHEGIYKCIVDNGVGQPVDASMMVTVQNKPQVNVAKSKISSGEGETVDLVCTVVGQPKPQVKWYKDGKYLEVGSSRFGGSATNDTYTLKIQNLQKSDFGVYTCSAKNKYGTREKNITLTGFPDIPEYKGYRIEDDKVIVQWDVESSAPIKAHEMRYRKEGGEKWITVKPSVQDADGNIYRVVIELPDLEPADYEVVFRSQNEFGWGDESQPQHFRKNEQVNHQETSTSTEQKPAAETSQRGPNGSGVTISSSSSLVGALLATLTFKTLFNYL